MNTAPLIDRPANVPAPRASIVPIYIFCALDIIPHDGCRKTQRYMGRGKIESTTNESIPSPSVLVFEYAPTYLCAALTNSSCPYEQATATKHTLSRSVFCKKNPFPFPAVRCALFVSRLFEDHVIRTFAFAAHIFRSILSSTGARERG